MSVSAYGYFYNFFSQTVISGGTVTFSHNGRKKGIKHTPGSDAIKIKSTGDYHVQYSVVVEGDQAVAYALTLDDSVLPLSTTYGATSEGAVKQVLTVSVIITIISGSTLRLRNLGDTADVLFGNDDGIDVNNASISIIKLD